MDSDPGAFLVLMMSTQPKMRARHVSRWRRYLVAISCWYGVIVTGASVAIAQDQEAAASEIRKGGFATALAYLLVIVVVAIGIVIVCRPDGREEESTTSNFE